MNDWLGNGRVAGKSGLATTVKLDLPSIPTATPVEVVFWGALTITEAAEAAVVATATRLPRLEAQVADAVFSHYQGSAAYRMAQAWLKLHGEPLDVPVVDNREALKPYYQLEALYLPPDISPGAFSLVFWCKWDEENADGLGIRFRNWMIEEVGDALTTVLF